MEGRRRRVLVTGATGFIGRNLVERLVTNDFEVHATSRQPQRSKSSKVHWWQADLANADEASRIFSEIAPDFVFHLAGRPGAAPDIDLVLPTYHSLATSTLNVLLNATSHGCERVVLFASCNEPVAGDPSQTPVSPYAAAKWVGTVYGRMFHKLYRAPVVILRPFMAYGPGQSREKLIPSVASALLGHVQPLLTNCRTSGDWVYIDDVVDACIATIITPSIDGHEFDIGTGRLVSQRALVETLVKVSGRNIEPKFGAIPDRPHEHEVVADTERAKKELGWSASTGLEDGLRKTWDWYSHQPAT